MGRAGIGWSEPGNRTEESDPGSNKKRERENSEEPVEWGEILGSGRQHRAMTGSLIRASQWPGSRTLVPADASEQKIIIHIVART
jgi:hypothetical protein